MKNNVNNDDNIIDNEINENDVMNDFFIILLIK